MIYIYVLKLQQNKYYVGKTTNAQFRLDCHFNGNGSEWTKKYRPLEVLKLIPNCDDYDEDKYTRIYMDKYGIENVRGGSYTSIKLDKLTMSQLIKMSNSTNNKCFNCGKSGHFVKDCEIINSDTSEVVWCCEYCDKEFEEEKQCMYHERYCKKKYDNQKDTCFRCGRDSHYASSCYASTHKNGYYLN